MQTNIPTELDQTTATVIGSNILFAWLKRDIHAQVPLRDSTSGYLFSFDQSHPNPLPEQHREKMVKDPDAVPLSYYYAKGKLLWAVKGSAAPLDSEFERNAREFAGVWVPNDLVRKNIEWRRSEHGDRSRQSLMRERAQDVCEEYSAWRNGDCYLYYITGYKVRRDGPRVLDRYDDYKSENALHSYGEGRGRFFRWQDAIDDIKQAFGRVIARMQASEDVV